MFLYPQNRGNYTKLSTIIILSQLRLSAFYRGSFSYLLLFILFGLNPCFAKTNSVKPVHIQDNSSIANLYTVRRIHGQRRTSSGTSRTYVLYIPGNRGSLPKQPYPLVVMVHGFLMSSNQQSSTCRYLAERGFAVLAPNMSRIMWGKENRTKNVKDVVDQTVWLIKQSKTPNSPFFGLCDASRMAIAGNSSGGAICFEAALEAQKVNLPYHALCSLEGVPWDRTLSQVKDIEPMNILTLRAEPCLCNYHSNVLKYTERLRFATDDVKINGAHHCDAENPTSVGCMSVCGTSHKKFRRLFELIAYLYLRDSLDAPKLYEPTKSFVEVMNEMQVNGKVVIHLNHMQPTKLSSKSFKSALGTNK